MDTRGKLKILADAAKYDASCASSGSKRARPTGGIGNTEGMGICHSYTPDGRCISLLKILLTNYCTYDCLFCVNRISNDVPRARFSVEEVVDLTMGFYRRNYIEGLFLSSGIIRSADYTMEELVRVARTLRVEHRFGGYIHLKTIPRASQELIDEAGRWADRLSINIELPTQSDLDKLAPAKNRADIEATMGAIKKRVVESSDRTWRGTVKRFAPAGQTTQVVVGATESSDKQILRTSADLYGAHGLRRVYYSAYSPIPGGGRGLPDAPIPLVREHRLYQADWLFRFYGFSHDELTSEDQPNLDLDRDPKLSWALKHREFFPIDVNIAERPALLRVPGFGVRTVDRIVAARRFSPLRLADLAKMRVPLSRAKYFILTADSNSAPRALDSRTLAILTARPPEQLSLFAPAAVSAVSGEL